MVRTIPQCLFHFPNISSSNFSAQNIFSYQVYWRRLITAAAVRLLSRVFSGTSFPLHSLNGRIQNFFSPYFYICPYFALFFLLALNTNPVFELGFMRCDSEVWLPRQERKAPHSAGCGRVEGLLKLTSPLYYTSYTGTAFILLSRQQTSGEKNRCRKIEFPFFVLRCLNCSHGHYRSTYKRSSSSTWWFQMVVLCVSFYVNKYNHC